MKLRIWDHQRSGRERCNATSLQEVLKKIYKSAWEILGKFGHIAKYILIHSGNSFHKKTGI
jgi:hypothetical protein